MSVAKLTVQVVTASLSVLDPPVVVLVRHGETDWTRSGRHTGVSDIPLTAAGRGQARDLGRLLRAWSFALVLTSPSSRARETCRLAGFEDRAVVEPELREWNYGRYEGLTTHEIRKQESGWTVWDGPTPEGEIPEEVAARADGIIERAKGTGGNTVLFGHGHMLRVLASRWVSGDPRDGRHLALATASISVLGWERDTPVLQLWNRTPEPGGDSD